MARIRGTNIECGSAAFAGEELVGGQGLNEENISLEEMQKASKVKEKVIGIRELKKLWKLD